MPGYKWRELSVSLLAGYVSWNIGLGFHRHGFPICCEKERRRKGAGPTGVRGIID